MGKVFAVSTSILFFLISVYAVSGQRAQQSLLQRIEEDAIRLKQLLTGLAYGDTCSQTVQDLKTELMKQVVLKTSSADPFVRFRTNFEIIRISDQILALNQSDCDATKLLKCDTETDTCNCGEIAAESYSLVSYKLQNSVCKYKSGSRCAVTLDGTSQCESGSSCLTNSEKTECNFLNLVGEMSKYGETIIQDMELDNNFREKLKAKLKLGFELGKICTCQNAELERTVLSSSPYFSSSSSYRRRGSRSRFARSVESPAQAIVAELAKEFQQGLQ